MALLSTKNLTIEFPGVRALDNVSIEFNKGEIHALLGENGAGKSTLIKVMAGVWPCSLYTGKMLMDDTEVKFHSVKDSSDAAIQVIYQEMSLANNLTVAQNIFLGQEALSHGLLDTVTMYKKSSEVLKKLGTSIRPDTVVSDLTIGEQQMVEIAKALSRKARLLIFDEPTAALPEDDVERLFTLIRSLKAQGIGIIYISHKLNEIRQLADKVSVMRNGALISQYDHDNLDMNVIVSDMIGRNLDKVFPEQKPFTDKVLLKLDNISLTCNHKKIINNISLECRKGEVLGIAGLLGSGRTALFSLIYGVFRGKYDGKILFDNKEYIPEDPSKAIKNGIVLVTEDRKKYGLITTGNVKENMIVSSLEQFTHNGMINQPQSLGECRRYVDKLRIKTPSLSFPIINLSGGNQQKVILSRFLMVKPKLILLDDPTRGVDVGAKQEIYALIHQLAEEGIGIVFVSSELPEVIGVSHRIVVVQGGQIRGEFNHGTTSEEEVLGIAAGVNA
ncbi:MAG: sugar ABC transporter ATP-binding protein [Fibrobacter sp.]|nr:sugar ABC transporter ATP-binding protein [Fibrobacter sp.]